MGIWINLFLICNYVSSIIYKTKNNLVLKEKSILINAAVLTFHSNDVNQLCYGIFVHKKGVHDAWLDYTDIIINLYY